MNKDTPLAQGPVDVDVRARFEEWAYDGFADTLRRDSDGEYEDRAVYMGWVAWQAAAEAEREACAAFLDADADRMEAAWRKHLASGVGGNATSFHTIPRGYAQAIRKRSNAKVSGRG